MICMAVIMATQQLMVSVVIVIVWQSCVSFVLYFNQRQIGCLVVMVLIKSESILVIVSTGRFTFLHLHVWCLSYVDDDSVTCSRWAFTLLNWVQLAMRQALILLKVHSEYITSFRQCLLLVFVLYFRTSKAALTAVLIVYDILFSDIVALQMSRQCR